MRPSIINHHDMTASGQCSQDFSTNYENLLEKLIVGLAEAFDRILRLVLFVPIDQGKRPRNSNDSAPILRRRCLVLTALSTLWRVVQFQLRRKFVLQILLVGCFTSYLGKQRSYLNSGFHCALVCYAVVHDCKVFSLLDSVFRLTTFLVQIVIPFQCKVL